MVHWPSFCKISKGPIFKTYQYVSRNRENTVNELQNCIKKNKHRSLNYIYSHVLNILYINTLTHLYCISTDYFLKNYRFPDNLLQIRCHTRWSFAILILFCCLNGRANWESFSPIFTHLQDTRDLTLLLVSGEGEHCVLMFSCSGIICFMQSNQCFLICWLAATKMWWSPKEVSLNPTRKADRPEKNSTITKLVSLSRKSVPFMEPWDAIHFPQ